MGDVCLYLMIGAGVILFGVLVKRVAQNILDRIELD